MKEILKYLYNKRSKRIFRKYILKSKYGYKETKETRYFSKKFGFSVDEFYTYQLRKENVNNYISMADSYLPAFENNEDFKVVSNNKIIFPYVFGSYFNVAKNIALVDKGNLICLNDSTFSIETIEEYVKCNPIIIKPYDGSDGKNIYSICLENGEIKINGRTLEKHSIYSFFSKLDGYVIQNKLKNHAYSFDIFPGSLNTIRVITACASNSYKHQIVCATHRFGTKLSAPADNFSKGGLSALIDINSGVLGKATGAKTIKDGKRIFYSQHPDTGVQIEGITVPFWEEIKRLLIEFSVKLPVYKFIAWDIVVASDSKIYVLETNMKSSLDLFQVHHGFKNSLLGEIINTYKKNSSFHK